MMIIYRRLNSAAVTRLIVGRAGRHNDRCGQAVVTSSIQPTP